MAATPGVAEEPDVELEAALLLPELPEEPPEPEPPEPPEPEPGAGGPSTVIGLVTLALLPPVSVTVRVTL